MRIKIAAVAALAAAGFLSVSGQYALAAGAGGPAMYQSQMAKSSYEVVKADEVLQAGTIIPATLVSRLTSDNMSSVVIAVVRQNVYDSVTGNNVLIPAGSRLIGEPMQMSGSRINISFQRVIFPNGQSIELPQYEAIDGLGQSGLKDKYTKHTWLRFRSVLTGSLVAGVAGLADSRDNSSSNNSDDTNNRRNNAMDDAISALIEGVQNIAEQDNQDIQPTGTVREGYQFNIMLHQDIRIRPYR